MIPKQTVMNMLFDEIDFYRRTYNINDDIKKREENISKTEALVYFARKINEL